MSESDALRKIAAMWCRHDTEMRDMCAACIARDALASDKRGPAGGGSPAQDEENATGTYACPKCGLDVPHYHSPDHLASAQAAEELWPHAWGQIHDRDRWHRFGTHLAAFKAGRDGEKEILARIETLWDQWESDDGSRHQAIRDLLRLAAIRTGPWHPPKTPVGVARPGEDAPRILPDVGLALEMIEATWLDEESGISQSAKDDIAQLCEEVRGLRRALRGTPPSSPPQLFLFDVDGKRLESSERELSGGQIMVMAHVDPSCELLFKGHDGDHLVRLDDTVVLDWRKPSQFYTMARASGGPTPSREQPVKEAQ